MANAVKWETPVAETDILTTQLNSLSAGSTSSAGSAHDNQTNKDRFAMFELDVTFGSAPTAGGTVDLYLVPRVDLTNFVDSTSPLQEAMFICSFVVRNTTAQRIVGHCIKDGGMFAMIPPVQFKGIVVNNTDQAFPASGSTVAMTTFNEEIQ